MSKSKLKKYIAIFFLLLVLGIFILILANPVGTIVSILQPEPPVESESEMPEPEGHGLVDVSGVTLPEEVKPLAKLTPMTIRYIDIGQGDCVVLTAGGESMMIDTGYWYEQERCESALVENGISSLKYLVLTHPDADHIGNADALMADFHIKEVLMPDKESDTMVYQIDMEALDMYDVPMRHVMAGDKLTLGDATIDVLGPINIPEDPEDTNNASIMLHVHYGGTSFLFMGDAETDEINDLLDYCRANEIDLKSDILMLPHHGSGGSFNRSLYDAVDADYYVISCGTDNEYGHPASYIIEDLKDREGKILLTETRGDLPGSGTITAETDGISVTVTTETGSS